MNLSAGDKQRPLTCVAIAAGNNEIASLSFRFGYHPLSYDDISMRIGETCLHSEGFHEFGQM